MDEPVSLKTKAQIETEKAEAKDKEKYVWVCTCTCMSFYLHADGKIECTNCGHFSDHDGAWFDKTLRDAPVVTPKSTKATVSLNVDRSLEWRHEIEKLKTAGVNALVYVTDDGVSHSYGTSYLEITDEELQQRTRKLIEGVNMLIGPGYDVNT